MNTYQQVGPHQDTHSKVIGYLLWIFGFTGAHRFYYGKPVTGTIWFFTLGLLGIGWLIDLFLIPAMDREADLRFTAGPIEYNVAWILLAFLGVFGVHRMYQGKAASASRRAGTARRNAWQRRCASSATNARNRMPSPTWARWTARCTPLPVHCATVPHTSTVRPPLTPGYWPNAHGPASKSA